MLNDKGQVVKDQWATTADVAKLRRDITEALTVLAQVWASPGRSVADAFADALEVMEQTTPEKTEFPLTQDDLKYLALYGVGSVVANSYYDEGLRALCALLCDGKTTPRPREKG